MGCGSSGLVSLKYARENLPDWEIFCFEKSESITGCWGNPSPSFMSTSTKYTTQFACYAVFGDETENEFFCGGEYGKYLEDFADAFSLRPFISLRCHVEQMSRVQDSSQWILTIRHTNEISPYSENLRFDAVILCTGLAARPRFSEYESSRFDDRTLTDLKKVSTIRNQRVVVIGGGESAVDIADRLAEKVLGNQVYLSLRSGIRVSPRYHPIRGVPSDFLRNRLMLSIHPDLRNWIGERFVAARIRHRELFEKWFPHRVIPSDSFGESEPELCRAAIKKDWAMRLTLAAKDDLFNMFHNKSDRFLDAVADGRITIIGPSVDCSSENFKNFDSVEEVPVAADVIVPALGYESELDDISSEKIQLEDFFLGCCSIRFSNLFLIGFARPIIGNIPTISEMQARYVTGLIAGRYVLPCDSLKQHERDAMVHRMRFGKLNLSAIYPVEMIPYCDRLARLMDVYPTLRRCRSLSCYFRLQLAASTTMHYYLHHSETRQRLASARVFMPPILIVFLLMLKPIDAIYFIFRWISGRQPLLASAKSRGARS